MVEFALQLDISYRQINLLFQKFVTPKPRSQKKCVGKAID